VAYREQVSYEIEHLDKKGCGLWWLLVLMEFTHGFFPLDSIQFALVVWAFDGLPLILGVTGLMQLSLNYEILDTRQEATSLVTILLGPRCPTLSALQCGLPVMSSITYRKFL
jgi:hypothetical protein